MAAPTFGTTGVVNKAWASPFAIRMKKKGVPIVYVIGTFAARGCGCPDILLSLTEALHSINPSLLTHFCPVESRASNPYYKIRLDFVQGAFVSGE